MIRSKLLLSTVAAFAAMAVTAVAQERVVNIYNWSDYIDESVLEEFTKKTGIKVVYDVFDSNEILETKLLAGSTGYDIVVPTGTFLARQIQAGVFQELDKEKLPNLENMDPAIQQRLEKYDPGNNHAINYMWGTTGIGINVDKVKERLGDDAELNSWALALDPDVVSKLEDCGVYFLNTPEEVIPAALNYLGLDPDSTDENDLAKAEEHLLKIRPHIRKFHSSEYINALANGDICLAVGWSGDILQARDRAAEADAGVTVEYIIPKEGALMWFDNMAIPADAQNVEEAHEFLNYIMTPEAIAKASNYVYYANGNAASKPLLNEDVIGDPAIYPDEETVQRLYTTSPKGQREQRALTRVWTKVTTGQ
ncbi:polyamine ABC transporter substrate-binding protein [Oricola cellulosilytica]|uniref:Putrescine-binding periplasmic protein n=1 Tax=Oricola cellulosilytica TaxID=1429082 RepID=A0A4R0PIL8_9HYPH|nr:polyamine ABC transporter substrate-binding protein [Oricola cellulosilytica]TCD16593.1 polyamine ABC transporter substrate-binding protein [Oricola cellulosilytica]